MESELALLKFTLAATNSLENTLWYTRLAWLRHCERLTWRNPQSFNRYFYVVNKFFRSNGGDPEQIKFLLCLSSIQTTKAGSFDD
jgi:hypothetical protein